MSDIYPQVLEDIKELNSRYGFQLTLFRRPCDARLFDLHDGETLVAPIVSAGETNKILTGISYAMRVSDESSLNDPA